MLQWNQDYGPFGDGVRPATIDVVSLYTNIPHQQLQISHFLRGRRRKKTNRSQKEQHIAKEE